MKKEEIVKRLNNNVFIDDIMRLEEILIYCKYKPFVVYYNQTLQSYKIRFKSVFFDSTLFVKYIYNGLSKILLSTDFQVKYLNKYSESFRYNEDLVFKFSLVILDLVMNDFHL